MKLKPLPARELLVKLLDYNPETGIFTWKPRDETIEHDTRTRNKWNTRYSGRNAGYASRRGYILVSIKKSAHNAHRLAWLYMTGEAPNIIDHIDGNPTNNSFRNLRNVDASVNHRNTPLMAHNKSGVHGVYRYKNGTWCAQGARADKKYIHIGLYQCYGRAVMARKTFEKANGYHNNHGRPKFSVTSFTPLDEGLGQ